MRSKLNTIYFFFCWKGSDDIVQKKELIEQIGKLNVKIATSNKELEKLELEYKKKRIELKKYKNERVGLQLKLQELELECNKKVINENEIKRIQKKTEEKYYNDYNNEYYTQEKTYSNIEDSYMNYMRKNVVPYND